MHIQSFEKPPFPGGVGILTLCAVFRFIKELRQLLSGPFDLRAVLFFQGPVDGGMINKVLGPVFIQ
jgi:hypothetical protein